MPRFIVSACLAGLSCRYDGSTSANPDVAKLVAARRAIPVCPEALGGLPIPRPACEIRDGRVYSVDGEDMTDVYLIGAQKALRIAREHGCTAAILKNRSPSCGVDKIYDGTFSKQLVPGNGILADLLRREGFTLFTEDHLPEL